jgi:hypothetical protein
MFIPSQNWNHLRCLRQRQNRLPPPCPLLQPQNHRVPCADDVSCDGRGGVWQHKGIKKHKQKTPPRENIKARNKKKLRVTPLPRTSKAQQKTCGRRNGIRRHSHRKPRYKDASTCRGGGAGRPWQNAKQLRHTRRQAASAELEIAESCSPACRRRRPCPAEQENLSLQLPKKTKKHQLVPILPGQCRNSRQKRQKKKRAKDATENKRSVTAKIAPIMPSIT